MFIIDHQVETTAQPKQVWELYKDVEKWSIWDHEIESVALEGPFKQGTSGKLKPKGGPEVKFTLTQVELLKSFSDTSFLPLCRIDFDHTLEPRGKKLIIRHRVEIKGFLSPFFAIVIGRKIKKAMPSAMEKLTQMAEKG